jgi:hypothetical protein
MKNRDDHRERKPGCDEPVTAHNSQTAAAAVNGSYNNCSHNNDMLENITDDKPNNNGHKIGNDDCNDDDYDHINLEPYAYMWDNGNNNNDNDPLCPLLLDIDLVALLLSAETEHQHQPTKKNYTTAKKTKKTPNAPPGPGPGPPNIASAKPRTEYLLAQLKLGILSPATSTTNSASTTIAFCQPCHLPTNDCSSNNNSGSLGLSLGYRSIQNLQELAALTFEDLQDDILVVESGSGNGEPIPLTIEKMMELLEQADQEEQANQFDFRVQLNQKQKQNELGKMKRT